MLIKTGSTVLQESGFARLAGCRIGFIGNHTSRLSTGGSTLAAILESRACNVEKLFAPEHGAFGMYDDVVDDEDDPSSGLPILSLYGAHKKPTAEMLAGLDCLVFELQDVGARFYTYCSTLLLAIDAAYDAGIKIVVLDRPNPISGVATDGPTADADSFSFVAPYNIPIRTGLTIGELAILYGSETGKSSCLEVVPMEGWKRGYYFDQTGLTWIKPSPAMLSLSTAIVYPGVCLLEQTNVSVGRGTNSPFELVGAPFIEGNSWYRALKDTALKGVEICAATFTPDSSKHTGIECSGIQIVVTDRDAFHPVRFGIKLLTTLRDLAGPDFNLDEIRQLLANATAFSLLKSGYSEQDITDSWQGTIEHWQDRCRPAFIYDP